MLYWWHPEKEAEVIAMARKKTAKSLNEYRLERYMDVVDFVAFLGIATHTYYSALNREGIRLATMRRIAEKLGVHPSDISEFEIRHPKPEGQ
jgi:DNA-binding Xre family transcriptional regulator